MSSAAAEEKPVDGGGGAAAPPASTITLRFKSIMPITESFPPQAWDPNETIGNVQARLKKKLNRRPVVYLFLLRGSEGFIPTPDQTLQTLLDAYAEDEHQRELSIAVSGAIYYG